MMTQAERARINGTIAIILGLLFLVFVPQRSHAQMPCPDFDTAAAVEKSASILQEEAHQISRRKGQLVGDDLQFDVAYRGLKEAGIHAHYLLSSYQLYLHTPSGLNRDFIERHLLISPALEIRSLMFEANDSAARIRETDIKRMITEGLAARDFLGIAFSRCLLSK